MLSFLRCFLQRTGLYLTLLASLLLVIYENNRTNSSGIFSIEVDPGFEPWHGREWGEGLLSEINRDGQTEAIEDESPKMSKP